VEPDGRIGHIELDIGGATISLGDEYPEHDIRGPAALGGTPVTMGLRVPTPADVDVLCERAVARGATMVFPVADQFYGERSGRIRDPWGHEWRVTATIEDLTVAEMQERFTAEQAAPADTD
jgi:PhnB protein